MEMILKYAGARLAAGIAEDIAGLLVVTAWVILIALRRRRR